MKPPEGITIAPMRYLPAPALYEARCPKCGLVLMTMTRVDMARGKAAPNLLGRKAAIFCYSSHTC